MCVRKILFLFYTFRVFFNGSLPSRNNLPAVPPVSGERCKGRKSRKNRNLRKKNKRKVKKMKKWKVGDLVVMNDKYHVSEKNAGRVFEVRSEPTIIGGEECVFLTGFVGCYASDGLSEATRRQKTIYILQNLDDGRFETLVGKIEGYGTRTNG